MYLETIQIASENQISKTAIDSLKYHDCELCHDPRKFASGNSRGLRQIHIALYLGHLLVVRFKVFLHSKWPSICHRKSLIIQSILFRKRNSAFLASLLDIRHISIVIVHVFALKLVAKTFFVQDCL